MKRRALALVLLLAACAPADGPENDAATADASPETSVEGIETAAGEPTNQAGGADGAAERVPSFENRTDRVMPPQSHETAGRDKAAAGDACGAGRYRYLVGQHRSRIPAKPAGATWRVTCTSCPMTMDYSEHRLNILYDQRTETVEEVRCG